MGSVESVNVATVRTGEWTGRLGRTGIDKRPVDGRVRFTAGGAAGDSVCDGDHHGAWYQAAYAFDTEDLPYWSARVGARLVPGNAGENLSLAGCDCSSAVIGERWRIGTAVFRVTGPRIPCKVFAGFWDVSGLVKQFGEFGRPGTYLAVEQEGEVRAGDELEVLSRPEHGITVAEVFAVRMRRRTDLADHVAGALPDLPHEWAEKLKALT